MFGAKRSIEGTWDEPDEEIVWVHNDKRNRLLEGTFELPGGRSTPPPSAAADEAMWEPLPALPVWDGVRAAPQWVPPPAWSASAAPAVAARAAALREIDAAPVGGGLEEDEQDRLFAEDFGPDAVDWAALQAQRVREFQRRNAAINLVSPEVVDLVSPEPPRGPQVMPIIDFDGDDILARWDAQQRSQRRPASQPRSQGKRVKVMDMVDFDPDVPEVQVMDMWDFDEPPKKQKVYAQDFGRASKEPLTPAEKKRFDKLKIAAFELKRKAPWWLLESFCRNRTNFESMRLWNLYLDGFIRYESAKKWWCVRQQPYNPPGRY